MGFEAQPLELLEEEEEAKDFLIARLEAIPSRLEAKGGEKAPRERSFLFSLKGGVVGVVCFFGCSYCAAMWCSFFGGAEESGGSFVCVTLVGGVFRFCTPDVLHVLYRCSCMCYKVLVCF